VSALLPLGQARSLSGAEVLLAYVAGFEVNVVLGRQLNPRLYEAGWRMTRTLGVLGVTAACCRLLKLGPQPSRAALGIAASMASGLRQNFGTMTMALHAGLTARDAVHAALLAEKGFQSDGEALEQQVRLLQPVRRCAAERRCRWAGRSSSSSRASSSSPSPRARRPMRRSTPRSRCMTSSAIACTKWRVSSAWSIPGTS
jgi:2-methylcitrate dehydratase PrpD